MKERHSNAVFNFLDVGSEGVFIPNNPVLIGSHPYKNCEKLSVEDEQKLQNFLSFLESLEKYVDPILGQSFIDGIYRYENRFFEVRIEWDNASEKEIITFQEIAEVKAHLYREKNEEIGKIPNIEGLI